jgi:hypothetical protein
VRDGQTSPHSPWIVISRNTCPPLSPSPHATSILGTVVINTHTSPESGRSGVLDRRSSARLGVAVCDRAACDSRVKPARHEFIKLMIISLSLTQTHDGERDPQTTHDTS